MKDSDDKDAAAGVNPTATALALAQASRDKADAFLDKQSALADLQIADLKREDSVRHWSLRVRHISDVLRLTLELTVAFVVLGIAVLLGTAVYKASQDNSLTIESFSVPPDLAARGLTGQAIAAQLQDKLSAMQEATDSSRPPDSYVNNWGSDIKVQIPDTGVSVGEFYRMLVLWFGHQTHITGEVFHTAAQGSVQGIAITVRASGSAGDTVNGSADDLDGLLQKSAEAVYARTQAYRYAIFLLQKSQESRGVADAIFAQLIANGSQLDRAWSYMGIGTHAEVADPLNAPAINRKAIPLAPGFALPWLNIYQEELALGHDEVALAAERRNDALLAVNKGGLNDRAHKILVPTTRAALAAFAGDYQEARRERALAVQLPDYSQQVTAGWTSIAFYQARLHEPAAARRTWNALPPLLNNPVAPVLRTLAELQLREALDDWNAIVPLTAHAEAWIAQVIHTQPFAPPYEPATLSRRVWPYQALALAHTGDMAGALALIGKTPRDCYICVRIRGRIDAMRRNWKGADSWFALAVHQAPSLPFAETEWGQMLLARGDLDGAIVKFAAANKKGPHFADPLALWGEALMAKNRSDLALAKFGEAAKYAPNWGRLHMKWGEALLWSGNKDEAKKELARAATLDLSAAEKAELSKFTATHQ